MSLSAVCTHSLRLNIYQYTSLCHEPAMLFTPHPHPHPMHGKQNEAPCPLREIKPLCYDAAVAPTMFTCPPPENKEEKEKKNTIQSQCMQMLQMLNPPICHMRKNGKRESAVTLRIQCKYFSKPFCFLRSVYQKSPLQLLHPRNNDSNTRATSLRLNADADRAVRFSRLALGRNSLRMPVWLVVVVVAVVVDGIPYFPWPVVRAAGSTVPVVSGASVKPTLLVCACVASLLAVGSTVAVGTSGPLG